MLESCDDKFVPSRREQLTPSNQTRAQRFEGLTSAGAGAPSGRQCIGARDLNLVETLSATLCEGRRRRCVQLFQVSGKVRSAGP